MKSRNFQCSVMLTAFLLLLVVGGCQNLSQEPVEPAPRTVSVADAKEYYEATRGRSKVASKYQFLWGLAEVKRIRGCAGGVGARRKYWWR